MESLLPGKNIILYFRFFASLRFALKRMFDKTVENRNGFVNDKCLVFRGGGLVSGFAANQALLS
ncbi:MAG: hypothetical protein PHD00_04250, partial [Bacteroidales bacterium]|nr:hypothetical protein [Bacteroidales bacterium]